MTRLRQGEQRRATPAAGWGLPGQRVAEREDERRLLTESDVVSSASWAGSAFEADSSAVMEACELVEHWCVRRVIPASQGLLDDLRRIVREQSELIDDPAGFLELDWEFHRAIVQAAGNSTLAEFHMSLREGHRSLGLRALESDPERAARMLAEHHAVVDAMCSGDPDHAGDALAMHLSSTVVLAGTAQGGAA